MLLISNLVTSIVVRIGPITLWLQRHGFTLAGASRKGAGREGAADSAPARTSLALRSMDMYVFPSPAQRRMSPENPARYKAARSKRISVRLHLDKISLRDTFVVLSIVNDSNT